MATHLDIALPDMVFASCPWISSRKTQMHGMESRFRYYFIRELLRAYLIIAFMY